MHLSELDDDGGGRPWGHQEAESRKGATGEVEDVGEAESREGAGGNSDGGREGRGTSMSSMTSVDAWGGNLGVAGHGGTGKRSQGRGPPTRSVMPGSRVGEEGCR
jgi:hypothetical protein